MDTSTIQRIDLVDWTKNNVLAGAKSSASKCFSVVYV